LLTTLTETANNRLKVRFEFFDWESFSFGFKCQPIGSGNSGTTDRIYRYELSAIWWVRSNKGEGYGKMK
jgi:hypothetical protein